MGKTLEEIYSLPSSEITIWKQYFSIFPFSQERADQRTAVLASTIANVSGKTIKKPVDLDFFMPDYLNERSNNSLIEQARADMEFGNRLKEMNLAGVP